MHCTSCLYLCAKYHNGSTLVAQNTNKQHNAAHRAHPQPTNHLDTTNVAWLQQWLVSQRDVTLVTVSHDSAFLDAVCTGEWG